MKSRIVKQFKEMDVRKISGKKIELYSFYDLCGYMKLIKKGEPVETSC